MKKHFYSPHVLQGAPGHVKSAYWRQGLNGSVCGYVRNATTNPKEVTCKLCLRAMKINHPSGYK